MQFEAETINKLTRLESKLVRGFEEMGIDTGVDPNWLVVNDEARTLYVATLGRSIKIVHSVAIQRGASQFQKFYDIVHKGDVVGTIKL
jgi:hypothetical protein